MAKKPPSGPGGLIIVDKPAGITSHDVVARIRKIARTRKVGHAGTLDPMATGVLIVGVERSTKLLNYLLLNDKTYQATIRLGARTTTDDADGETLEDTDTAAVALESIRPAMAELTGAVDQRPASVSAIKVDGQRAYARVRAGETVDLAARAIEVARFELRSEPVRVGGYLDLDVEVECSSGTYVRALARDLGDALGVGGHLTALRRTRVGHFGLDRAVTLEELAERDDPIMLPLSEAIGIEMPVRTLAPEEAVELSFGRYIDPAGIAGTYGGLTADGIAVALLEEIGGRARPVLGFTPAGS
ncbi:tRNA pseudouridine(55) synthase TruB [Jatrophihabitans telluris]|uniref:tRNA pseudouridine synthase B n=1 Tax=Jatrophihabitans telluris TaxID=2038343 RepID=A0ABY4R3D7_9ACTN|nr:tRNA pseudouridine(55) synthase TruB [Jatrophihabitans telluris]UQX90047.1 tRNA pseudouridine(55) synthase TruB [Jatrophihabitans telluris]